MISTVQGYMTSDGAFYLSLDEATKHEDRIGKAPTGFSVGDAGLRVSVDGAAAEAGARRVVASLDAIKAKTEAVKASLDRVGKSPALAGEVLADDTKSATASTAVLLDEIVDEARAIIQSDPFLRGEFRHSYRLLEPNDAGAVYKRTVTISWEEMRPADEDAANA